MKFLLDTCVISEVVKKKPNLQVIEWLQDQDENDLYLSVITFAEIEKGIAKAADEKRKCYLTQWLETELKPRFKDRVINIDYVVASQWALTQSKAELVGKPMPTMDSLIAASAFAYHCTLVTRNIADMQQSFVTLLNPWEDHA